MTRDRIRDGATALFDKGGIDAISMREVARQYGRQRQCWSEQRAKFLREAVEAELRRRKADA